MLGGTFFASQKSSTKPAIVKKQAANPAELTPDVTPTVHPNPKPSTQTLLAISTEYASLQHASHCPTGFYILPSPESLLVWHGVFFVHKGYYASSILRFNLTFPLDYPSQPPSVQFTTDVFHPLVSQKDGLFSLAPRFSPWRPNDHHVFDLLHWMKAAFKKHSLDQLSEKDCSNAEAYRYRDSTSSFSALALQTSGLSQSPSALFDRDHPHMAGKNEGGIMFRSLNSPDLQKLRERVGVQPWDDSNDD